MMTIIGGSIALCFGFIGFLIWWSDFISFFKGIIPQLFILGGILAIYLGTEELKDKKRIEDGEKFHDTESYEKIEKYKEEVAMLKAKLANLTDDNNN